MQQKNIKARSKTLDKTNDFYTVAKVGKTREVTPEGYLLCRDVALARTGVLYYSKDEIPVEADDTSRIIVSRGEEDLFRLETIASAEAKPVTNEHPDTQVDPENWKALAVGTALNIRRGIGFEDSLLMGDLLITDKQAIDDVQNGKVEISLGYDTDYTQLQKGRATQSNIVINHIALVNKGRCGNRCAIQDSDTMANKTNWLDRLRGAKKTMDEALEEAEQTADTEAESETEKDDEDKANKRTTDALSKIMQKLNTMDADIQALKKTKDAEDPPKNEEDETETKDDILGAETAEKLPEDGVQNYTGDSLSQLRSRLEILAPGFKLPTLDSATKGIDILKVKRSALKQAYVTADGQKAIALFIGDQSNIDLLPAYTVDAAFIGAAEIIKQQNNTAGLRHSISTKDFGQAPKSISDINALNRKFWANRQ